MELAAEHFGTALDRSTPIEGGPHGILPFECARRGSPLGEAREDGRPISARTPSLASRSLLLDVAAVCEGLLRLMGVKQCGGTDYLFILHCWA